MKKIYISLILIFSLLLIVHNISYAREYDLERDLEINFDEYVTDEGTYFVRKNGFYNAITNSHASYITGLYTDESIGIKEELFKLVNEVSQKYIDNYIAKGIPEEQKIKDNYYTSCTDIYNLYGEYNDGDDIYAVVGIHANPIDGNNNYWKNNYPGNELIYSEYDDEYTLLTYFYVTLSTNQDTGEYEIIYVGKKPENYDEYVSSMKETFGIDMDELDIDRILNTKYTDTIIPVASSNTEVINGSKNVFNLPKEEAISRIAQVIRVICTTIIAIIILIVTIRKIVNHFKK